MPVMRVSSHRSSARQMLRHLPLAATACLLMLGAAGCHSDSGDASGAEAPPAPVSAAGANGAAAAGAPPSVSTAVQAQIDASRKAQAAAFASHYRSGPTGPVKPN